MDGQRDLAVTAPGSQQQTDQKAQDYRLFYLNADGHIERGVDLKFYSDEQAVAHVKTLGSPYGVELWQGRRMVREFLPGE